MCLGYPGARLRRRNASRENNRNWRLLLQSEGSCSTGTLVAGGSARNHQILSLLWCADLFQLFAEFAWLDVQKRTASLNYFATLAGEHAGKHGDGLLGEDIGAVAARNDMRGAPGAREASYSGSESLQTYTHPSHHDPGLLHPAQHHDDLVNSIDCRNVIGHVDVFVQALEDKGSAVLSKIRTAYNSVWRISKISIHMR
jgi:hypothetical protein